MLHNLVKLPRYRGLIQSLVARDLKARYRGSVLGFLWSFMNPLLLLLVYTFVFTYALPQKIKGADPYPLFLFCGLLPWTWFSTSLMEAAGSLISGGNLIKKVLFPAEVLPIVTVTANMVHFILALPILGVFLIIYRAPLTVPELLCFPLVVLVQYIFTLACALILAALTVHFRDIKDILANILTLWYFATPIIYPYQYAPEMVKRYLNLNPFAHLAISYQEIFFFPGPFGHWKWLAALGVASIGLCLFAYFIFDRLRDSFAEEV
ncbi:MAG TPA: ABC transporter permease [Vicinamibacterales bacterium]|jgi:ABC-type polysaccharide/polyol phosphate export permease